MNARERAVLELLADAIANGDWETVKRARAILAGESAPPPLRDLRTGQIGLGV